MRGLFLRAFALALSFASPLASPVAAEVLIPPKRLTLMENTDLPGGDIASIFNTDLSACEKACLASKSCTAMVFNSNNNSCFLKSDPGAPAEFGGAWAGRVIAAAPGAEARAIAREGELSFIPDWDWPSATALASAMADRSVTGYESAEEHLTSAAEAEANGDADGAWRHLGAALNLDDRSALWTDYARLLLLAADQDQNAAYQLRSDAFAAALNGWLRSDGAEEKHDALLQMARALEANARGADMVRALRLAQSLAPRDTTAALLEEAVGKYGLRVTETQTQTRTDRPRLCAVFSEDLAKDADFAPFVQLPDPGLSVALEGTNQLCIEGVAYGQRYQVTFRAGLPAASGETMAASAEIAAYIRDRDPGVRFAGRGYVLPRTGAASVPVVSVNLKEIDLQLWRVSDRNLLRVLQNGYFDQPIQDWQEEDFGGQMAVKVWEGKGEVAQELNRDVTTRLPLEAAIADQPAGIYALRASVPGKEAWVTPPAWQWFVVSDLGLSSYSGASGLDVFVHGLGDARPREGVAVDLLSVGNEVLASAVTDAAGHAGFAAGLTRGEGAAAPGLVIARGAGDEAFLSLTDPEFDLSDRGVEGRPAAAAVDVFLTTDRGAYRAGETVHAVALARDGVQAAIADLPLTAVLTRPDGVEYSRQRIEDQGAGGHVFDFAIGAGAPRGPWRIEVFADPQAPALASQRLLVEDFVPERIDFKLASASGKAEIGAVPEVSLEARYLFGAPGADLVAEGEILLQKAEGLADWPGYRFGREDSGFSTLVTSFAGLRTDAQGHLDLTAAVPQAEDPGIPLQALIAVRLAEGSARPVERRLTLPVQGGAMIGVKPLFEAGVAENAEARFQVVGVGADGKAMAMQAHWTLTRIQTDYQWYQTDGMWYWEPVTRREKAGEGDLDLTTQATIAAPVAWGDYELVVRRTGAKAETMLRFFAGWGGSGTGVDLPDALEMALDKPAYAVGEVAELRLAPKAAGRALITVLSNGLIDHREVEVVAGENVVPIEVTEAWGTGAYVTATVLRPMDVAAGRNPARALGLVHASVAPGARALNATIEVAPKAAPRAPLEIAVKVDGLAAGEAGFVTVAAVDQGILNLTGFEAPDPQAYYFGQKKLGVGLRDLYGRLIDGMNGAEGTVRSGGDAGANARLKAPPPTEELVAFFSGPIEVGADGKAHVSFDLPAFNGTVKVMALAWSAKAVGQAASDVVVRDPVVIAAALPRFLAPGDASRLALDLTQTEGASGTMGLAVTAPGLTLGAVPATVTLAEGQSQRVEIPITAAEEGVQTIDIALTTPEGQTLTKSLKLAVIAGDPEIAQTRQIALAKGERLSLGADLLADFKPGSGRAVISAGPLARLNAAGVLAELNAYPYGCTEQIAAKALPLLYFDEVAQAMDLPGGADLRARVTEAVQEILTHQDANGAFGLWAPGQGDMWLDAFVTDVLSRAKAEGIAVPDQAFRMALDNLRNQVNYFPDFDRGGEALAYGLMVLAREGAAAVGDLRYYADQKAEALATPMAMAQLGAALALYGDQPRADRMFAMAEKALDGLPGSEDQVLRVDYGTPRRDAAAVLALAFEAGSKAVDLEALTTRVAGSRPLSTQEATWTLLAAHAALQGDGGVKMSGVAGGPLVRVVEGDLASPIEIANDGADTVVSVSAFGRPEGEVTAGGNGYAITRSTYTLDGKPAALDGAKVGDRFVAVVEVTPFGRGEARLLVEDPLPAGFEIDNPNLLAGGALPDLDFLDLLPEVAHAEFRTDRFMAALDRSDNTSFRLAYILRAVSPGVFHQPAASVSDMYRPDLNAQSDAARVTVTP